MKTGKLLLLASATFGTLIVASGFYCCGPGGSGIIATHPLEDGGEVLVTQEWTGWIEPYEVTFWYRAKGEDEWLWRWINFESNRWHNARIEEEDGGDYVLVYEGEELWLRFENHNRPFDPDYVPKEKSQVSFGPSHMKKGEDPYAGK